MSAFRDALRNANPDLSSSGASQRQWIFVPYDQLTDACGPLAELDAERAGVVLVENRWKAARRPYHRQKLGLVLANMRNFALEQAERGVAVRYLHGDAPYAELLEPLVDELGTLRMAQPTERELQMDLEPLVGAGSIEVGANDAWLTQDQDFEAAMKGKVAWRMDVFYRHVRRELGILIDDEGKPVGGKWSFDTENRESWSGQPEAPKLPRFDSDPIRQEVQALIEAEFDHHPGALDLQAIPTTQREHEQWLDWVCEACMEHFGPYEDAMSRDESNLFHTRLSVSINLGRLPPRRVVDRVLALDIPLASKEGFVRQIIGWREFMRHVHRQTDGFRTKTRLAPGVGDGGWAALGEGEWAQPDAPKRLDGQADPQAMESSLAVPPTYWGRPSGLACLDHVVDTVWAEGYSHHITRLMILSNLATLMGVSPRSLADWFWCAYIDAFDWVVEPNVLGMGTFGLGDLFTTKPYVSGAAYINRMSNYCGSCQFHPKKTCPITPMYWAFLDRNVSSLAGNHRLAMPLRSLAKRPEARRGHDRAVRQWVVDTLASGEVLDPSDAPKQE